MGVMLQAFYWDCPQAENREHQWWSFIKSKFPAIANAGFTALWLPPANKAASWKSMATIHTIPMTSASSIKKVAGRPDSVLKPNWWPNRVCARTGVTGLCRSRLQPQQRRRCTGDQSTRWQIALDKVHAEERKVCPRLGMFSPEPIRDLGRHDFWRHARPVSPRTIRLYRAHQLCALAI